VEAGRGFAVDLLQTQEVSALKDADRRLATELVMGVLRWRGELDFQIEQCSGRPIECLDPEVLTILRMGVYQIQFLERVPKAATVNEAVEITKAARKWSARGLVNAVLRKCPPGERAIRLQRFDDLNKATLESVRRATPAWLLDRWASNFSRAGMAGDDVALRLAWASTQVPPTALRVVDPGEDIPRLREELREEGIKTRPGRFLSRALVVESGNVQASHALMEGRLVIQDEASQLVADLLAPRAGHRVLDLCAAPGIKAGQIAQALGSGTLVTCDLSAARLRTMARLLPQWLPKGVRPRIIRLDATEALPFRCKFERILLDAPCSGTGTLARNPEIKWRLRQADLYRCAEAQVKMLKGALGFLSSEGRLVYATCSLEPEENEGVVERVLKESQGYEVVSPPELKSAYPALSRLVDSQGYLRTRPDLHPMDGFFAVVIVQRNQ
jgi:16S rRNA (cytosine967-C5)-methyltransferase